MKRTDYFSRMEPKAIPIVKLIEDGDKSYELDEQALSKILLNPAVKDRKVAIISVVGAFRKGKSFLLNFFVLYLNWLSKHSKKSKKDDWFTENTELNCFPWRGGSQRDTCGILMWSQPFIVNDKDGNEIAVLLMDTQGTFDANSTMAECATIFALSTMISSFQIYNISQAIQEDYLQHLRLFIEYGILAMEETDNKPFQTLLFLIRDWQSSSEHAYGYAGGTTYLDQVLKKSYKQKKELQELRKEIKSYFEELICFLLPHPGLEVATNRNLKKVGKLEADFKEEIQLLVPSIFDSEYLVTKEINGQEITCKQLMHYFKAYMNVFNSDKLPEPKSILQATGEANNVMAASEAKAIYEIQMKTVMDSNVMEVNILLEKHNAARDKAVKKFREIPKMGGVEMGRKHEEILYKEIETRYTEMVTIVKERARIEEARQEQIRRKKEMEEEQRKAKEELERKRREQERAAMLERERLQREREEHQRRMEEDRRRAAIEAERQARARRAEEERLEKERKQIEEQRRRAEQEEQERRARVQREEEERRERNRRESEQQAFRMAQMFSSYGGGTSSYGGGFGGNCGGSRGSTPSSSSGVTYSVDKRGVRHYRAANGRFCKKPDDW